MTRKELLTLFIRNPVITREELVTMLTGVARPFPYERLSAEDLASVDKAEDLLAAMLQAGELEQAGAWGQDRARDLFRAKTPRSDLGGLAAAKASAGNGTYRCKEPGWKLAAMNDPSGRRGIWFRRAGDGKLEICAGRGGDDRYVALDPGPQTDAIEGILWMGATCIGWQDDALRDENAVLGGAEIAVLRHCTAQWFEEGARELGRLAEVLRRCDGDVPPSANPLPQGSDRAP